MGKNKIYILVACEESQAVTTALRDEGFNAFSCDLLPCSGGKPEYHFKCDIFKVIKNPKKQKLQTGSIIKDNKWNGVWHMMIAHPPCTYLAVSGARWFYDPKTGREPHPRFEHRRKFQKAAIKFFIKLWNVPIEKIAIENPVGIMSSIPKVGKPSQIVQPYMFGDEASKKTCLWLKNLPNLVETNIVGKGVMKTFKSGKSQPKWYSDALTNAKTSEERRTLRSKTFKGMATEMAKQWTKDFNI